MARDRGLLHCVDEPEGKSDPLGWSKGSVFFDVTWGECELGPIINLSTRSLTQMSLMPSVCQEPGRGSGGESFAH